MALLIDNEVNRHGLLVNRQSLEALIQGLLALPIDKEVNCQVLFVNCQSLEDIFYERRVLKIVLPRNTRKIIGLAQKIVNKHVANGETSPIAPVIPDDMAQTVTDGLQLNTQAEELERQMEKAYKDRDAKVDEALKMIKRSRDLLKGIYSDNLRDLGEYGFTVND